MSNTPKVLPTLHSNGTSQKMLADGYDLAADKLYDFAKAWGAIEFNARDYYVQGPDAWTAALEEREAVNAKIREIKNYLDGMREHLHA